MGHSGEARGRLDSLVIGTVRPATDEELRISRDGEGASGKVAMRSAERAEAAITWVQENVSTLKKVGAVGAAGAFVLCVAIMMQRYGARTMDAGRR